ncbi:MAG: glycosyltransferase family 4 protein [Phycisphaerales bacterium]|nr:glycosyltransferase family 4 protein [Phycisphaerales bacterium]
MTKVLYIAFACEPGKGSEPEVGWNFSRLMANHCQTWIITDPAHRDGIEAYLRQNPHCKAQVVYHTLPRRHKWMTKLGGYNLHYYLWQRHVRKTALSLHHRVQFDLVHHVTYARYWMPSAARKLNVPFVWGPVGGAEGVCSQMLRRMDWRTRLKEAFRSLVRRIFEWQPATRRSIHQANLILAGTEQTARRLRELGARRVEVVPMIGCTPTTIIPRRVERSQDEQIRFASAGRLLYWKGFDLGLRAFAEAKLKYARYTIIGDGPERRRLMRLAARLGIDRQVEFTGALTRDDCLGRMEQADVLVHPSLHDSGGYVCLEAMCQGKPIICLDVGGPAIQVGDDSGFKIVPGEVKQVIADIATAMRKLAVDDDLCRSMGQSARQRMLEKFTWEHKRDTIEGLYQQVLSANGNVQSSSRPMTGNLNAQWAT